MFIILIFPMIRKIMCIVLVVPREQVHRVVRIRWCAKYMDIIYRRSINSLVKSTVCVTSGMIPNIWKLKMSRAILSMILKQCAMPTRVAKLVETVGIDRAVMAGVMKGDEVLVVVDVIVVQVNVNNR